MRHVKKVNPEKRCLLQYDKLYIDGKLFSYSETSGRVEQQLHGGSNMTNGHSMNGLDKHLSDEDRETIR